MTSRIITAIASRSKIVHYKQFLVARLAWVPRRLGSSWGKSFLGTKNTLCRLWRGSRRARRRICEYSHQQTLSTTLATKAFGRRRICCTSQTWTWTGTWRVAAGSSVTGPSLALYRMLEAFYHIMPIIYQELGPEDGEVRWFMEDITSWEDRLPTRCRSAGLRTSAKPWEQVLVNLMHASTSLKT